MIGTIRKHQTWLWGIIIIAVIVSFVIYFTPTARVGRGGGVGGNYGTINGRSISRKQYVEAAREAQLSIFLRNGVWLDSGEAQRSGMSLERETRNRLVLIDCLNKYNVQVPETAVAQFIVDTFNDPRRPGTAAAAYQNFIQTKLDVHGVTEAQFQEFARHQTGIMHLLAVAGTAGKLVTAREATALFRQEQEKVEAQAAIFSASNYLAKVTLDPVSLAQFYTNNRSLYRVPERVQLHYVTFSRTNYETQAEAVLVGITNLAAYLEKVYLGGDPGKFTDTNGQVLPPEAAKKLIREQMRNEQALVLAHKAAASFATNLETITPLRAENLLTLANKLQVPSSTTEPFRQEELPVNLKVGSSFGELAFRLTPEEPISSPVVGDDRASVYLVALKQKFPSELPAFENIRLRVTEDFMRQEATRLARAAGTSFAATLTNALAQGKSFADACASAGVTPVRVPAFALASQSVDGLDSRLNLEQLKRIAANTPAGKTTDFLTTPAGGFVLFVNARVPVADAEMKTEFPKFLVELRQSEQYQSSDEWFRRQLQLSRIDTVRGRDEEPAGGGRSSP